MSTSQVDDQKSSPKAEISYYVPKVIHQNNKHKIDYFLTSQALNDYISRKEEVSTLMLGFGSHTSLVSVFQVGAGLYSIYLLRGHPLRGACLQEAEENS